MKKLLTQGFSLFLMTFLIACAAGNDEGMRDVNNDPRQVNFGPDDFSPRQDNIQRDEYRFFTDYDLGEYTQRDNYQNPNGSNYPNGNTVTPDNRNDETARNQPQQPQGDQNVNDIQQQVVDLTNQEREKNGLKPLKIDTEVMEVAQEKSEDMAENDYFSHNSPTYGSPFDMMKDFGVDYQRAAENIAAGQQTPESVVEGWMNSPGHRKNILNGQLTHIGVGYDANGDYWTQMFIRK
ncbi:CAP domain-containing protein [Thalassobacillus devorans]|uniref:CAP domain-containing protein n=1 Tax=Thalassobacillus devorans TaxID=279813 RepID=UPI000A1CAE8F|nr:CAP domain-containing protein [Thalassobacillus devorans]